MTTIDWTRAAHGPQRGRRIARVLGLTLAGTGLVVAIAASVRPTVETRITAAPVVTPVLLTPPPIVVLPAPVVAAAAPAEEPPPRPRALAPALDGNCVLPADEMPPSCSWDDGFPAISADGSQIAIKEYPDDGGRGNPGLTIRFVDVETSRLVRAVVVLDPDEYDEDAVPQLQAKIDRRALAIQRTLDAGRYRTLELLSEDDASNRPADTAIHAELDGDLMRIVDPATATVLWRHRFVHPAPRRASSDDDDFCGGWSLYAMSSWWDPPTGTVLASSLYRTGGCLCTDVSVDAVAQIPR
jgi:hypothetical protein